MFVLGLIGTLWSVNIFDVIWLLTQGGPANGTTTLPVYIYEQAFQAFNMGGAAAASMIMGVALFRSVCPGARRTMRTPSTRVTFTSGPESAFNTIDLPVIDLTVPTLRASATC